MKAQASPFSKKGKLARSASKSPMKPAASPYRPTTPTKTPLKTNAQLIRREVTPGKSVQKYTSAAKEGRLSIDKRSRLSCAGSEC